ncbi:uncharacterized protein N7459_000609 [Penicillium hispanicum]|uniref:uncharacterized protein n=1 Tax=Penicillium hispanicum TaxID=1080232 RepID=UPI002541F59B|nr:uncharacterized protein N7459_000609 [Penicillium hispanicum]KAJ5594401.1 hypothetical protein N7459_000609 [Penicillium hispanicum]
MPPFFDRFRGIVPRRRRRATGLIAPKESIWKRMPDHVFVRLVAFCELEDIASLTLACRLTHARILRNESAISQAYLSMRKKKPGSEFEGDNFLSPGDDLTFITELFPPPPPQYAACEGQEDVEYSLAYLTDLKRCWATCVRLSFHLADHVVRYHLETDTIARPLWSSSKTEKEVVYTKAVGELQARLLHPLAYAIFFLESSASPEWGSSDQMTDLASFMRRQQFILQEPPFTDTQILLSTQHCMELLCSTVRRLMGPDFPWASSESWVTLLLLTSTLERVVQFFQSIASDTENHTQSASTSWSHRKEFLWQMRSDLGQYMASIGQISGPNSEGGPMLDHVWFGAAHQELLLREAIPHRPEYPVPVLHGSEVTLHCKFCYH